MSFEALLDEDGGKPHQTKDDSDSGAREKAQVKQHRVGHLSSMRKSQWGS
jgi:hypothetical protein